MLFRIKIAHTTDVVTRIVSVVKIITYSIIPPPHKGNTFSQAGEDVVIDFLLEGNGINRVTYLELGTNLPDWCNNTYLFYKKGGKGVLVEADETIIPLIKKIRPHDKILNIGVGLNNQKEADFYIFENNGLNTFSKEKLKCRERREIENKKNC
jgi:hypothetical protein